MKTLFLTIILSLGTSLFLQAQSAEEEAAMEAIAHDYMQAYNQQDVAALQNFYTDDATRVDQEGKILKGADQIAAFFAEQFKQINSTISIRHLAVNWSDREHAFVASGTYEGFGTLKANGAAFLFTGRYYNSMLKDKETGQWKITNSRDLPLEADSDNR
jgi:uncharacterized protein (TIGR02246 family)